MLDTHTMGTELTGEFPLRLAGTELYASLGQVQRLRVNS